MNIERCDITIGDALKGYWNREEDGVRAYDGRLDIRPPYQREFIYKNDQRDAVIDTIRKGYPLNVFYWSRNKDGTFEVLDGQQRMVSIGEYLSGSYSIAYRTFHNLTVDEQNRILNYPLQIYICDGTEDEKLEWFRTINIAGVPLTEQELLNAMYVGPWLMDAKRHFSRTGCPAYRIAKDYIRGTPIRQDFLETALKWVSKGDIQGYMSAHQHDPNASELWLYFQSVVNWVDATFPKYRKEMKGVDWGRLYDMCSHNILDRDAMERRVSELMMDDDVTRKSGIYEYVLTGEERCLNIRTFTPAMKRGAYERQDGVCPMCGKTCDMDSMHADHITPWHLGGRTITDNCRVLCADCNRRKSGQ